MTESLVNKRELNSPTTPTWNLLMFFSQDFLTPLFQEVTKLSKSINFCDILLSLWAEPGENARRGGIGDGGGGGWAGLLPRWVKVSLLAWWLVHSADVTWSLFWGSHLPVVPGGLGHSVFWAPCDWQDPCSVLFYPDLLLHLPPVSKGPGWLEPQGRQSNHAEKQKRKLWRVCYNVNWEKLMM